ncbi:CD4-1 molecule isoform X2 [Nelusetta ayraudi]|uniref:CD4-1 molecule isoform X2 n=1 Tax=Nelusetta ayraudi TaxID=303726 RepID=UPI003F7247BD
MKNQMSVFLLLVALLGTTADIVLKYVQLGGSVTLDPPAVTGEGRWYYIWYFGNTEIASSNSLGGSTTKDTNVLMSKDKLTIKNVSQDYFGMFYCKELENARITYRILQLHVSKSSESPVLSGESLTLECRAETLKGLAKPQIHWLDQRGAKVEGSGNSHTIAAATVQDNGQWTCVVTSHGTVSKGEISVSVAGFSTPASDDQYTSNVLPLAIPCSISTHIPWEQIKAMGVQGGSWDFFPKTDSGLLSVAPQRIFTLSLGESARWQAGDVDTGLISTSDFKMGDLSLTRSRGREGDAGNYVCRLEFNRGRSLEKTVRVHVLQIVSSPGTELVAGQTANLTCGLGVPLPSHLRLKWVPPRDSPPRPLLADGGPALLRITADLGDSGKWRCELWRNHTKEATAEITLRIESRQSVWMLVIICSAAAIGFLLMLLLFICWQRRQRMRHPRHRLCKCENPKPKGFYRT